MSKVETISTHIINMNQTEESFKITQLVKIFLEFYNPIVCILAVACCNHQQTHINVWNRNINMGTELHS
jgi:hypothetical protein